MEPGLYKVMVNTNILLLTFHGQHVLVISMQGDNLTAIIF